MDKIDFKKQLKHLYGPTARMGIHLVEVPAMRLLMVDGHGDPNTVPQYREAVETLYAVAYALKFASKKQLEKDYVVPPLERRRRRRWIGSGWKHWRRGEPRRCSISALMTMKARCSRSFTMNFCRKTVS